MQGKTDEWWVRRVSEPGRGSSMYKGPEGKSTGQISFGKLEHVNQTEAQTLG